MNFNKLILGGRLTRDPELRHTQAGKAVTQLGLAVNNTWRDSEGEKHEEAVFVEATAWGKMGEVIAKHLKKGDPIFVEGRLKYETWEDRETGAKRSTLKMVVEVFQFVGGRDREAGTATTPTPATKTQPRRDDGAPPKQVKKPGDGIDYENIPF